MVEAIVQEEQEQEVKNKKRSVGSNSMNGARSDWARFKWEK